MKIMILPKNTKAIFFDMDGVLFNTEDLAHTVFSSLCSEYGYIFSENDHREILGSTEQFWSQYFVSKMKTRLTSTEFARIFWDKLGIETANLMLMPGVTGLFEDLEKKGIQKCLVTSSPRKNTIDLLTKFDINEKFACIITGEDVNLGKPYPDPYLAAIRFTGFENNECVVIEDSVTGVSSGKAAGCYVIAVPTIHANGMDYSSADVVIESLEEIQA